MPQPILSEAFAREALDLVEQCLREGFVPKNVGGGKSAVEEAAKRAVQMGMVRTTAAFGARVAAAEMHYGMIPDASLWAPVRYQQPVPTYRIDPAPPPVADMAAPAGHGELVLIVPDLHQDPRQPHRRDCLKWIARFGADRKIPRVEQLGDWSTWDSISSHDKNDTRKARTKPPITADMDDLIEGLKAWNGAKGEWKPKQRVSMGNHEYRVERFENITPEAHGTFTAQRDQAFSQFGWRTVPFGEVRYVEGVGITHHAINGSGRPFGGKLGSTRVTNEATCSMIVGHSHVWKFWPAAKIGPLSGIEILEAGCALPWGEIESYALHSLNDWWWGVTVATLQDGRIRDLERVSMLTLRKIYSDDGADAR